MGLAKRLYILLLLSLSLGLFCGELPESMSLSDDVANDFVEDSAAPPAGEVQEAREIPIPAPHISLSKQPTPQLQAVRPVVYASLAVPDLLRLFSIQRK